MGFLSNLLPVIAGGALAATGVGAPAAAAIIGGLQTARTGSLQKGLMAGLGAYGGAGLGGNLAALGESAAADVAAKAVPQTNLTGIDALDAQTGALQDYNTAMQTAREGAIKTAQATPFDTMGKGITAAFQNPSQFANTMTGKEALQYGLAASAPMLATTTQQPQMPVGDSTMPQRLKYNQGTATPLPAPDVPGYDNLGQDFGRQRNYFPNAGYQQITPEEAKSIRGYATGGYMGGGPVEQMSNQNAIGQNTGYPQADITGHAYATPWQTPTSQNVVQGTADTGVNRISGQMLAGGGTVNLQGTIDLGNGGGGGGGGQFGQASANGYQAAGSGSGGMMQQNPFANDDTWKGYENQMQSMQNALVNSDPYKNLLQLNQTMGDYQRQRMGQMMPQMQSLPAHLMASGGMARGGLSDLGSYSDGGRLLRGPGDGVSDSIPAVIGKKRPARLADGEFVVPARIVSELGNGSTEAGARKLYAMLDRVQSARKKSIGKDKVAHNSRADKYLPA